jgi:hypothetical protein
LLSAGLAPGDKYVPAKVEVTQVRFGGARGLEVFKHVAQLRTNSLNIVTLFKGFMVSLDLWIFGFWWNPKIKELNADPMPQFGIANWDK